MWPLLGFFDKNLSGSSGFRGFWTKCTMYWLSSPACSVLIYSVDHFLTVCRPLVDVFDKCYYITISYDECKRRRRCVCNISLLPQSSRMIYVLVLNSDDSDLMLCVCVLYSTRQYSIPDPPGLFDGHVWPMYLKHRAEMVESCLPIGAQTFAVNVERCTFLACCSNFKFTLQQKPWMV